MTFPIIPASTVNGSYQISRSLRFRKSASANLTRTFSTPTSGTTWTWSAWMKRGALDGADQFFFSRYQDASNISYFRWNDTNILRFYDYSGGVLRTERSTNAVFRDPSAWYHVVLVYDSNNGTPANRARIYVNNVEQTYSAPTNPNSGQTSIMNSSGSHQMGSYNSTSYFDGYLAEVNFIDGQALTPSSFGAFDTNGVWQPIACTVSDYGKNGFYLPFSDSANIFNDKAAIATNHSAANNWTASANINTTSSGVTYDWMLDSPTNYADGGNGRGNYCTWNPTDKNSTVVITDGNLSANSGAVASAHRMVFGSQGFTTPSYFEITTSGGTTGMICMVGCGQHTTGTADGVYAGSYSKSFANGYATNATNWYYAGVTNANGSSTNLVDGTWGFAVDPANGKAWVRNTAGSWIGGGDPAAGTLPTFTWTSDGLPWFPIMSFYNVATTFVGILNAGQRSYAFTAPSGFSALNTQNLPTPTIANGAQYMGIATYPGNAGSNSYSSLSFQPDFLWSKSRTSAAYHYLIDSVRGTSKAVYSNATDAEGTITTTVTFNTNGVAYNGSESGLNANTQSYVNWLWKKGASQGFDIQTFTRGTGAITVNHSLGVAPQMIIIKNKSNASNWKVYHQYSNASPQAYSLNLNDTSASANDTTVWNNTLPTSSSFQTNVTSTSSSDVWVAYCFAPVAGYSAFGSYAGNSSSDGPFVYTGFRPRWIMIKIITVGGSAGYDWYNFDTARDTYNAADLKLVANGAVQENQNSGGASMAGYPIDILSNGFKIRNSGGNWNASTYTYIYAAFAENPFKYSRAR